MAFKNGLPDQNGFRLVACDQAAVRDRMLRLRERAELDRRTTLGAAEKQDKA